MKRQVVVKRTIGDQIANREGEVARLLAAEGAATIPPHQQRVGKHYRERPKIKAKNIWIQALGTGGKISGSRHCPGFPFSSTMHMGANQSLIWVTSLTNSLWRGWRCWHCKEVTDLSCHHLMYKKSETPFVRPSCSKNNDVHSLQNAACFRFMEEQDVVWKRLGGWFEIMTR